MTAFKTLTGGDQYKALSGFNRDAVALFGSVSDSLSLILTRSADTKGTIPPERERTVQQQTQAALDGVFTGPDRRNAYAADGITPQSKYARILNYWMSFTVAQAVFTHHKQMAAHLPPDVKAWMKRSPLTQRTPRLQYDPPHKWVDPNGYRLSDRIWRMDIATRQKIDGLITDGIRQGKGATQIAKELEQFLNPNRKGIVTRKPYGSKGSYDAMRLARTEITAANGSATIAAAQTNPFVTGIDWALSASHPQMDICDELATISMSGERLKDPYPVGRVPTYPAHPHCLCTIRPATNETAEDRQQTIDRLRQKIRAAEPPPLTPYEYSTFVKYLIGPALFALVADQFSAAA